MLQCYARVYYRPRTCVIDSHMYYTCTHVYQKYAVHQKGRLGQKIYFLEHKIYYKASVLFSKDYVFKG